MNRLKLELEKDKEINQLKAQLQLSQGKQAELQSCKDFMEQML